MNDRANSSPVIAKIVLLIFVLMLIAVFMMKPPLTSSLPSIQNERVFENAIPAKIPIRVKIKKEKEKSFKDLKNEKWAREFELELTNTGDKPIYYLDLLLVSDVKFGGNFLVFPFAYGRAALGDIVSKAGPDDTPIKPGETFIFKIHPGQITAWEKSVREGKHPEARQLQIKLETLSYGDGTGLFGNSGTEYPSGGRKQLGLNHSPEQPKKRESKNPQWPRNRGGTRMRTSKNNEMPVSFLPASFFVSPSNAVGVSASVIPADACLFEYCYGVIPAPRVHVCYNCPDQNRPTLYSAGICKEIVFGTLECTAGTETYLCQTIDLPDCGFGPGPTPLPTSTPAPAPCGYCTDPNAIGPADCSDPYHPTCGFDQIQRFGCCYPVTCPSPQPPPPTCQPGYMPGPFLGYPQCEYAECVPAPPSPTPPPNNNGCYPSISQLRNCPDYDYELCKCPDGIEGSPIIVDVLGNGFALTNASGGVNFDLDSNSIPERLSWTTTNSDDAFLALDRNGNGWVDNGGELFGNFTPQPAPAASVGKNGFLALAVYDNSASGGNNDGVIDSHDAVFSSLRLWRDSNHNAISETGELKALPQLGLKTLDLDYKESRRTDQYGNRFRYRAKVRDAHDAQLGRWAWDVFLVGSP